LGDTQALGGLREAAPLDYGAERCELARIDKGTLSDGAPVEIYVLVLY
jgi:hypothetical protein